MIRLHCYTHTGYHAHGGLPVRRPDRQSAEREAEYQSLANNLSVFVFEDGCWPRAFRQGVEIPMKTVGAGGEILTRP